MYNTFRRIQAKHDVSFGFWLPFVVMRPEIHVHIAASREAYVENVLSDMLRAMPVYFIICFKFRTGFHWKKFTKRTNFEQVHAHLLVSVGCG